MQDMSAKTVYSPSLRRGSALQTVLITMCLISTLLVTAWLSRPVFVRAQSTAPVTITAHHLQHQHIIESIAALIAGSSKVLAIHPRGHSPFVEIVLRMEAAEQHISPSEIAVISHSRILQTITFYSLEASDEDQVPGSFADAEALLQPGFCDRWRGSEYVMPRVLARGILDMVISPTTDERYLLFELTWASDSADGMDKASVLIERHDTADAPLVR